MSEIIKEVREVKRKVNEKYENVNFLTNTVLYVIIFGAVWHEINCLQK